MNWPGPEASVRWSRCASAAVKGSRRFSSALKEAGQRATKKPNTKTRKEKLLMGRVDGKTALVTGASRGIGRAIAIELAREGAKVAINYSSSEAKAKEVAERIIELGGTAILYKANIGNSKEVRAMVETVAKEFGHLDILVNNAGITRDSLLPRMTDEQWVEVIQTNLNG